MLACKRKHIRVYDQICMLQEYQPSSTRRQHNSQTEHCKAKTIIGHKATSGKPSGKSDDSNSFDSGGSHTRLNWFIRVILPGAVFCWHDYTTPCERMTPCLATQRSRAYLKTEESARVWSRQNSRKLRNRTQANAIKATFLLGFAIILGIPPTIFNHTASPPLFSSPARRKQSHRQDG